MREKSFTQRRGLRIGIIDDDPCALQHEVGIVSHVQNRNGCHISIWSTTKLDVAIHECAYSPRHTDIIIIDIPLIESTHAVTLAEIKSFQPGIIIIGITAHIDRHVHSLDYSQYLHCMIDKAKLNCELPSIIDTIYSEKTPRYRTDEWRSVQKAPPPSQTNRKTNRQGKSGNRKSRAPHHSSDEDMNVKQQLRTLYRHHDVISDDDEKSNQTRYPVNSDPMIQKTAKHDDKNENKRLIPKNKRKRAVQDNHDLTTQDLATTQRNMAASSFPRLEEVPLSPSELRVIHLCSRGLETDEVAERLSISSSTVYSHRSHIMSKYHARSWHEALIVYAKRKRNGTA